MDTELVKFWCRVFCIFFLLVGLVLATFGTTMLFLMVPWPESFGLVHYAEGRSLLEKGILSFVAVLVVYIGAITVIHTIDEIRKRG